MDHVRSLTTGIILIALCSIAAHATTDPCGSHAQDTIATDRPQITSSGIVVPCGSLQFENGFAATGNAGQTTYDFPETSVRIGILSKTELRLGVPDYLRNNPAGTAFGNGFSDITLGFKQQLGPVHGFDVSIIPAVSLPTGAHAISSHGYDPSVQIPWSRALTKTWTAAGMLSVAWPTQGPRRNVTGQGSIYFDRQLTAPWALWRAWLPA
jgi:hypothetical protein